MSKGAENINKFLSSSLYAGNEGALSKYSVTVCAGKVANLGAKKFQVAGSKEGCSEAQAFTFC